MILEYIDGETLWDYMRRKKLSLCAKLEIAVDMARRTQFIPAIYGFWHPAMRHWVGFSAFTINREGNSTQIDRDLGELMFFNVDTQIDEENQKTKARYGFTGFFLGIDVGY